MNLSIIIVNWNSQVFLRRCLASITRHCSLTSIEIIVVDSGSFDGCAHMLATEFPHVRFIQSDQNVGFARANNLGVRHAKGRFLLFLNPDTLLTEDTPGHFIHRLAALPLAGAIGCRLINADGTLQTSCVQSFPNVLNQVLDTQWLRELFPRSSLWGMSVLHENRSYPSPVAAVSGACIAVNRAAFTDVGGFTESYFMYGEDLDLCRKLHDSGWTVFHSPETSVIHLGGGSSRQAPGDFSVVMMRTSIYRFMRTHQGKFAAGAYRLTMGASALIRLALIGPAGLFGHRLVRHGAGSWRKWRAVLRWSTRCASSSKNIALT